MDDFFKGKEIVFSTQIVDEVYCRKKWQSGGGGVWEGCCRGPGHPLVRPNLSLRNFVILSVHFDLERLPRNRNHYKPRL